MMRGPNVHQLCEETEKQKKEREYLQDEFHV